MVNLCQIVEMAEISIGHKWDTDGIKRSSSISTILYLQCTPGSQDHTSISPTFYQLLFGQWPSANTVSRSNLSRGDYIDPRTRSSRKATVQCGSSNPIVSLTRGTRYPPAPPACASPYPSPLPRPSKGRRSTR